MQEPNELFTGHHCNKTIKPLITGLLFFKRGVLVMAYDHSVLSDVTGLVKAAFILW